MTGTAKTQLTEFEETYKLGVVEIPTNRPMVRTDNQDVIYKSEDEKWNAVADDIIERNERASRSSSAPCRSRSPSACPTVLNRRGIEHNVLNAKNHEKEAHDRGAGRAQGRGDGRDEHGRAWRRHPPRRQPRVPRAPGDGRARVGQRPVPAVRDGRGRARRVRGRVRADPREVQGADRRRARRGGRVRRALRARDRAPRVAPDRQPAARTVRAPGRPRRVALLPLAGRRPDADVRERPGLLDHGAASTGPRASRSRRRWSPRPSRTRRSRSRSSTTSGARTS